MQNHYSDSKYTTGQVLCLENVETDWFCVDCRQFQVVIFYLRKKITIISNIKFFIWCMYSDPFLVVHLRARPCPTLHVDTRELKKACRIDRWEMASLRMMHLALLDICIIDQQSTSSTTLIGYMTMGGGHTKTILEVTPTVLHLCHERWCLTDCHHFIYKSKYVLLLRDKRAKAKTFKACELWDELLLLFSFCQYDCCCAAFLHSFLRLLFGFFFLMASNIQKWRNRHHTFSRYRVIYRKEYLQHNNPLSFLFQKTTHSWLVHCLFCSPIGISCLRLPKIFPYLLENVLLVVIYHVLKNTLSSVA